MIIQNLSSSLVLSRRRSGLSTGLILRVALAVVAVCLALGPTLAAEPLVLKGDVGVKGDALTLRDLVQGVSGAAAEKPLFKSPSLGQTGTIQARRIVESAVALGFGAVETGGRTQVTVTRSARRIAAPEIEAAVKAALEAQGALEVPAAVSVALEGTPLLVVHPDLSGPVAAEEVSYDRRTRRLTAVIAAGRLQGERAASLRVTGTVIETVDVAVLTRALARGETVQPSDVAVERRTKGAVPSDPETNGSQLAGRVARRPLVAGSVVRSGDLGRPEVIARGEAILLVYEVPGLNLSVRGRANEGGALGDTISVTNPQSKRTVQATVTGPGKAAASAVAGAQPALGPLADASAARP
jgi:flagella basal body P-ring formation protein FlgA